jgi:hypothetical protein
VSQDVADKPSLPTAIATTGLLAGVLDGLSAVVNHLIQGGRAPQRIFKYIASGVFGPSAMTGGTPMVVIGVCFHLLIAMAWTVLFFLAAQRLVALRRHAIVAAIGYGLFVWCVMNLVVIPLSHVQQARSFNPTQAIIGALILVAFIGFPVSLRARYYFGAS